MTDSGKTLSYQDSGVDIDAGNQLVKNIAPVVKNTYRPGVLTGLGGFGGLFELPSSYKEPVLVSGTDGVGTKLKLAIMLNRHNTIGIDLVAMCANDIVVSGAEPLYFLDYFATGKLDIEKATDIISGIVKGCQQAGMALIGGETAEMPGMYLDEDYDLAGFAVGIIEKSRIILSDSVKAGDVLLGIGSSGPHSNGYSLIRKIIELSGADLNQKLGSSTLGDQLLMPTRIYVKAVLDLHAKLNLRAVAHITGGGLPENLPRVLPDNLNAVIDLNTWKMPEVFKWLKQQGNVEDFEMLRTFNCGIGMVVCVSPKDQDQAIEILKCHGEQVFTIGRIKTGSGRPQVHFI